MLIKCCKPRLVFHFIKSVFNFDWRRLGYDKVTDKMNDDSAVTEEEKPVAEAVELKESVPEETPTKATENEDEPMETEENEKAFEDPVKSVDESEKKTDEEQSVPV